MGACIWYSSLRGCTSNGAPRRRPLPSQAAHWSATAEAYVRTSPEGVGGSWATAGSGRRKEKGAPQLSGGVSRGPSPWTRSLGTFSGARESTPPVGAGPDKPKVLPEPSGERTGFCLLFSREKSRSALRPKPGTHRDGAPRRPQAAESPGGLGVSPPKNANTARQGGPCRAAIQVRHAGRGGTPGAGGSVRKPPGLPAATSACGILCIRPRNGAPGAPAAGGKWFAPKRERMIFHD